MTKVTKQVDFTGQRIYIGLDVHLKNWQVAIYAEGRLLKNYTQPASIEVLDSYLRSNYPNAIYVCAYESGFSGFWIQRALEKLGYNCIVVNAADIPQTDKGAKNKTDKVDAKRIGQSLEVGFLKGIYIPSKVLEADRRLVRSYNQFTRDLTRAKNQIKGLLYYLGIQIPTELQNHSWGKAFIEWIKNLKIDNISVQRTILFQLRKLEFLKEQKRLLLKEITELITHERYAEISALLQTVPGIGVISAATFLTEIGEMERFENHNQLNSFVGLCPTSHSSGERERLGSMTGRHNRYLRVLLIEAAWRAIAADPAMTKYYGALKVKIGGKRAIVKVAVKLLNRIRYVWLNETEYITGIVQ
jgi:transposase